MATGPKLRRVAPPRQAGRKPAASDVVACCALGLGWAGARRAAAHQGHGPADEGRRGDRRPKEMMTHRQKPTRSSRQTFVPSEVANGVRGIERPETGGDAAVAPEARRRPSIL